MQGLKDKLSAKQQQDGSASPPAGFRRLAALNRAEWMYGVLGLLCAAAVGLQVGTGEHSGAASPAAACAGMHGCSVSLQPIGRYLPAWLPGCLAAWLPGCLPGVLVQMPGFSLALSEVVSDLWQPDPADIR